MAVTHGPAARVFWMPDRADKWVELATTDLRLNHKQHLRQIKPLNGCRRYEVTAYSKAFTAELEADVSKSCMEGDAAGLLVVQEEGTVMRMYGIVLDANPLMLVGGEVRLVDVSKEPEIQVLLEPKGDPSG